MRISSLFSLVGSAISIAAATPIHDLVEPRSPIIGGTPAKLGSVPFMVSIRDSEGQHVCGGSLISSTAVLTALHCLENEYNLRGVSVLAGTIVNQIRKQKHSSTNMVHRIIPQVVWCGKSVEF